VLKDLKVHFQQVLKVLKVLQEDLVHLVLKVVQALKVI
jgi:hypothetical protein